MLYYEEGLDVLRSHFFKAKWYEVYDFVEFVYAYGPRKSQDKFTEACNKYLERENSGYRFVDEKIVEISSKDEIAEIETAISKSTPYYGVRQHLSTAVSLLSDKKNPDYRNSIKESISAVEALCKIICKDEKATLGAALKILERKRKLHSALKTALTSLYGYTNDADGIRHALMEESNVSSATARFMLISCSAFINYVIASIANDV